MDVNNSRLLALPMEVLDLICSHLDAHKRENTTLEQKQLGMLSLGQMRLANSILDRVASRHMFAQLTVVLIPDDLRRLEPIANSELSGHVTHVNLFFPMVFSGNATPDSDDALQKLESSLRSSLVRLGQLRTLVITAIAQDDFLRYPEYDRLLVRAIDGVHFPRLTELSLHLDSAADVIELYGCLEDSGTVGWWSTLCSQLLSLHIHPWAGRKGLISNNVARSIGRCYRLQALKITRLPLDHLSRTPLLKLTRLREIRLTECIPFYASVLCDIISHNCDTLQEVSLLRSSLQVGVWESIFVALSECKLLTKVELENATYDRQAPSGMWWTRGQPFEEPWFGETYVAFTSARYADRFAMADMARAIQDNRERVGQPKLKDPDWGIQWSKVIGEFCSLEEFNTSESWRSKREADARRARGDVLDEFHY